MGKKKLDPAALEEAFKNFQTTNECRLSYYNNINNIESCNHITNFDFK